MPDRAVRSYLVDSFLLFGLTAALIWPLFRLEYLDNWASIDATFISDSRFLAEHWPHPGWQLNWYTGTRFDYVYPPALRYGTAALSRWLDVSTSRAYHLYTAFFYCFCTAAIYLLARAGMRSRGWPWVVAAASTLVSPGFLFLPHFLIDYGVVRLMPIRLGVLVRYGEGPHMSSFAWLSIALAAAWIGLRKGRPGYLAIAAVASALVVSNNFYGATALAMSFPLLAWVLFVTERDGRVIARAAAVAVLACGLTAFWLTPSYLRVTMRNLALVSQPGNAWSAWLAAVVLAVFAWTSWRWARGRPDRAWPAFVAGLFALFTLDVIGNRLIGFRVLGEPERLVPEFELAFMLAAALALSWVWGKGWAGRVAVAVVLIASVLPHLGWIRRTWEYFPEDLNYRNRIEYRLTRWVHENLPGVRTLATGSVRFWYNAWFDLPQVSGGSEQGTLNLNSYPGYMQLTNGTANDLAIAWMQALGAGAIIVHDGASEEIYHDWVQPHRFQGALKVLYQDGKGNWIYEIPRRYPGLARVVDGKLVRSLQRVTNDGDYTNLKPYADAVENGPPREARWRRESPDRARVSVHLEPGEMVLVQETYDPAWRASSAGREVPITADVLDFMLIDPGPGDHNLLLEFTTPLENRIGRIVTLGAILALAGLAVAARRSRS